MPENITLSINGKDQTVSVEPDGMLLYTLRDNLGLHGVPDSAAAWECGACTVVMDGNAIRSCITPVSSVGDSRITTLEGLGSTDNPHPLQKAFIEEQAAQCGYCINGMIMSAKALLNQTPHPSRDDIKEALDGNLCRCGTHTFRAVNGLVSSGPSDSWLTPDDQYFYQIFGNASVLVSYRLDKASGRLTEIGRNPIPYNGTVKLSTAWHKESWRVELSRFGDMSDFAPDLHGSVAQVSMVGR